MISVEDFTRAINFRITGGSQFCWNCFSPDARYIDSDDSENDNSRYSANIIFGSPNFTVFLAEVHDYKTERSYRLFHPDYKDAYMKEAKEKDVNVDQAYDQVKFIDLDVDEDWLEKCHAIVSGTAYDTRVKLPLDIPDEDLLKYMIAAHERDMTFNQFVEEAIRAACMQHNISVK